ncbi:short-chain dehydrogenase/reductase [Prauserella marina]|uniref:NADP-dependent 3-hydroxy acid dehydrogenase YdfG n=1 Tax=Prauserella marina TaxID=530584 RepID=A0A222VZ96_9PSEU|nr:oxidoreductase [Prauserella marina]ASR39247.1 short-chain dehydrogenase/reductase [Prauserella marina]PWV84269.1 NADP-dependent 3-hydroxy acid dehydrogenase YdfG [Prauserella marina]SDC26610.1 NADP-dependent 3-hydroxy acid dehydrogenase YdfG [Prauserella marina]
MTRTWFITGSSSGFGRALCLAALSEGDNVVATARQPETLEPLVAQAPDRALALGLDVTEPEQIDPAIAAAHRRFGGIDVLVNNAGFASVGAVEELEDHALRQLMDVMFFSTVSLVRAVLPGMRERRRGSIVQMSSMGGQVSMPGFGAYCAAKFALEGLSDALAAEVEPHGIGVLIVEPGAFATSFGAARSQVSPDSSHYADTVGPQRAAVAGMNGSQPGDPAKAAAAILHALGEPSPPRRLALGADAIEHIGAALDARRAELDEWAPLSRSTAR